MGWSGEREEGEGKRGKGRARWDTSGSCLYPDMKSWKKTLLLRHLEAVQNAAARFVTGTGQPEYMTPVLSQLRWLPLQQCSLLNLSWPFWFARR